MAFYPMAYLPPQFSNPTNGENASGFILEAYVAGTTSDASFYTFDGTDIGSSITLDSGGFTSSSPETSGNAFIPYLDDSVRYKFVLTDPDTLIKFTVDNVYDPSIENSVAKIGSASNYLFATVATMATKTTVGGDVVTPVLGQKWSTQGFHSSGGGGHADYLITNDTPNGTSKIDLGGGFTATLTNMGTAILSQYGGVGGNATQDTAAFLAAQATNLPILLPPVTYANRYIITGEVELNDSSIVHGMMPAMRMYDASALTLEQAYIGFADASSRFVGGSAANDRVRLDWKGICFVGANGFAPDFADRVGYALGIKTGNPDSAYGGTMINCYFHGFETCWHNDWAYGLDCHDIGILNSKYGLIFDDWNASMISKFYATGFVIAIDTGADSSRSVFRDLEIYPYQETEICVRCNAGVSWEGFSYFEDFFPSAIGNDSVCIAYQSSRFSARPVVIENILFDCDKVDYHITIGGTGADAGDFVVPGVVRNCKFKGVGPQVGVFGFGIHNDSAGAATHPNCVIEKIDISSCSGLAYTDLTIAGSPYLDYSAEPHTFIIDNTSTAISGASYTRLPLDDTSSPPQYYTNIESPFDTDRYIVKKPGVYAVSVLVRYQNTTGGALEPQAVLRYNGSAVDVDTSNSIAAGDFGSSRLQFSAYLSLGDQIYTDGRLGDNVIEHNFSIRYISEGL